MLELLEAALGMPVSTALAVSLLVAARVVPLVLAAPWLRPPGGHLAVRGVTALVLVLALFPLTRARGSDLVLGWALAGPALREALVGSVFAVAASVPLHAMQWAGELVGSGRPRGTGGGVTVGAAGPLGQLYLGATVAVFLASGGHRVVLAALGEGGLRVGALGSGGRLVAPGASTDVLLGAALLLTRALTLAVALALPALATFVVFELWLGAASRAAPSLRAWTSGMPLRAGLGVALALATLAATLPRMGPVFVEWIEFGARSL